MVVARSRSPGRTWRTRKDPFGEVWESELLPKLAANPSLQAITLLEWLQARYPGACPDNQLRTLQRHVKLWRVLHCRVVSDTGGEWILFENVVASAVFTIPGYTQQRFALDLSCRRRDFVFRI